MKIKNCYVSNEQSQIQSCSSDPVIDTDEILEAASTLQCNHGSISSLHYVYLDIVKEVQVQIIDQLKNDQFDEPYFIARTTANFIQEIANDMQCPSKSSINKIISKFQTRHSDCEKQITSSQFGPRMMFDFMVNYVANLEDVMRANAMVKSGITTFTQKDKDHILSALASVIYRHSKMPTFPKNLIGTYAEKFIEKLIKFGIKQMGLKHINKSASLSRILIRYKPITNLQ